MLSRRCETSVKNNGDKRVLLGRTSRRYGNNIKMHFRDMEW